MMGVDPELIPNRLRDRKTVVDAVVDWLRGQLVRGRLRPGEWLLPEDALARSLGVSRASVREALKILTALGVVEVVRGRGTRIATSPGAQILAPLGFGLLLEPSTSRDLMQLRYIIEMGSVDPLVSNATAEAVDAIEALATRFAALVEEGAPAEQLAEQDIAFHGALLDATGNRLLALIGRTVSDLFRRTMEARLSMPGGPRRAAEDHLQIAQALRDRDAPAMKRVVEQSLAAWGEAFERERQP